MKILIAMDSFKGSLSSLEAGHAAAEGIGRVLPDADLCVLPLADGGEGTTEALVQALGGTYRTLQVSDPLGRSIPCHYGVVKNHTAILEMASAAGLTHLQPHERNPLHTTTYGVGEMITDALHLGCRHFVIGIGGSATNDGGIGMLQALGFKISDAKGDPVPLGAIGLRELVSIRYPENIDLLRQCSFHIACDVTNPLCGEQGCSTVYAPQKGAEAAMVRDMDKWLSDYAALVQTVSPAADPNAPGAGAAGGLGFALLAFLQGKLMRGVDLVLEEMQMAQKLQAVDLVVTGEGQIDWQTAFGKAPVGLARLAKMYGKPVIALAGSVTPDATLCHEQGIDALFPILRQPCTLTHAMKTAHQNLADTAEQVFRVLSLGASFRS